MLDSDNSLQATCCAGCVQLFSDRITELLERVINGPRYVVVTGDFNINFIVKNTKLTTFLDLMESFGLRVQISDSTRQNSCLDNIFVNFDDVLKFDTRIVDMAVSDHFAVELNMHDLRKRLISKNVVAYSHRPYTRSGVNILYDA